MAEGTRTDSDIRRVAVMFVDFRSFTAGARTRTPQEVVRKLQEESFKALKSSAVTERFATDSAVGGGGPPAEFAAFIAKEQGIWKEIVRKAGIKAD